MTTFYHERLDVYEMLKLCDEILQAVRLGLSLDIHWLRIDQGAVFELALQSGLTTYDASYLHVARSLDIPLATFDEQLRAAQVAVEPASHPAPARLGHVVAAAILR